MLRIIWRVNRNGTSHAVNRENIGENHNVRIRLRLCNTVVLGGVCGKSYVPKSLASEGRSRAIDGIS
jgi:hypothetical protein